MKKIVAFMGSPRSHSYTGQLIDEAIRGAKEFGVQVVLYNLNEPNIRGCQSCFDCRLNQGCTVQDYLSLMYEDIKEASGIIFGSPIYFFQITGQAKIWMDRLYPLTTSSMTPRYAAKKVMGIYVQGTGGADINRPAIDQLHTSFRDFCGRLAQ